MERNFELIEDIGCLIDKVDNYIAASNLPLTPAYHYEALKLFLPELKEELVDIYLQAGGDSEDVQRYWVRC